MRVLAKAGPTLLVWLSVVALLLFTERQSQAVKHAVPVRLTIIGTDIIGSHSLDLTGKDLDPKVDIFLQNVSSKQVRVWTENNSSGWDNLSLEVTAIDRKRLLKPVRFVVSGFGVGANVDSAEILNPGQKNIHYFHFKDVAFIGGLRGLGLRFPRLCSGAKNEVVTVTLLTVFPGAPSAEFRNGQIPNNLRVWKGQVASAPVNVTVHLP